MPQRRHASDSGEDEGGGGGSSSRAPPASASELSKLRREVAALRARVQSLEESSEDANRLRVDQKQLEENQNFLNNGFDNLVDEVEKAMDTLRELKEEKRRGGMKAVRREEEEEEEEAEEGPNEPIVRPGGSTVGKSRTVRASGDKRGIEQNNPTDIMKDVVGAGKKAPSSRKGKRKTKEKVGDAPLAASGADAGEPSSYILPVPGASSPSLPPSLPRSVSPSLLPPLVVTEDVIRATFGAGHRSGAIATFSRANARTRARLTSAWTYAVLLDPSLCVDLPNTAHSPCKNLDLLDFEAVMELEVDAAAPVPVFRRTAPGSAEFTYCGVYRWGRWDIAEWDSPALGLSDAQKDAWITYVLTSSAGRAMCDVLFKRIPHERTVRKAFKEGQIKFNHAQLLPIVHADSEELLETLREVDREMKAANGLVVSGATVRTEPHKNKARSPNGLATASSKKRVRSSAQPMPVAHTAPPEPSAGKTGPSSTSPAAQARTRTSKRLRIEHQSADYNAIQLPTAPAIAPRSAPKSADGPHAPSRSQRRPSGVAAGSRRSVGEAAATSPVENGGRRKKNTRIPSMGRVILVSDDDEDMVVEEDTDSAQERTETKRKKEKTARSSTAKKYGHKATGRTVVVDSEDEE